MRFNGNTKTVFYLPNANIVNNQIDLAIRIRILDYYLDVMKYTYSFPLQHIKTHCDELLYVTYVFNILIWSAIGPSHNQFTPSNVHLSFKSQSRSHHSTPFPLSKSHHPVLPPAHSDSPPHTVFHTPYYLPNPKTQPSLY